MNSEIVYKALQEKVELAVGFKMKSPRNFTELSQHILTATKQYISPITLKRFFGYVRTNDSRKPYRHTLNVLAQYIGYSDIDVFEDSCFKDSEVESKFILNNNLQTSSLQRGAQVELKWYPDRCVVIQHEGSEMFRVIKSENSKLSVGDTFLCSQIIENEVLILHRLIHEGNPPANYMCGRINGVRFRIL